jgi:hypothetical protein
LYCLASDAVKSPVEILAFNWSCVGFGVTSGETGVCGSILVQSTSSLIAIVKSYVIFIILYLVL